ncbi:Ribosome-binding factor A [Candidatus Karelsulcia muelleri]|uniref:Ribosome-binding factor A n=1 Tax=Candidatus Karelsulcia muelleri TaxID=336810 RepID=A0A654M4J1_9FLAO|nr:ribosome-binding factor A [Candidatus Karelsulcia muelleri]AGS33361.1 Ribosome-binding factor A [Candidatus Karelsulcia muelleri str. Sulcia-ALF]ALP70101.1 Ribosome-binding factor A [Candidatus Karelsulcia muelleri]QND78347.1 Ribosome-binding factor A [Candidatus Karelsulcia muelleri]
MFKNKKAAILIKKKLSEIFNRELIYFPYRKLIIITKVIVIYDFSLAKIYLSFFPKAKENNLIKILNNQSKYYKKILFKKFKFKKIPNLLFKIDPNI